MLFAGNLSILGCGIEAGVAQVFLEQSQRVTGVIQLHRVYAKGIPEPVRANTSLRTAEGYRVIIHRHLMPNFGALPLSQL